MDFVAAILLVWTYGEQPIKLDLPDMPTCVAMREQIEAENTREAKLYTRCVGIPQ